MLWGALLGGIEVRASANGTHRLAGRFPYGVETDLGPRRREVIAARAFSGRVAAGGEIHLLLGHDFNRPLASTRAGSLRLEDRDDALAFEAEISPEVAETSAGRDALAMVRAGLATGVSPGFLVAPGGDEVIGNAGGVLRTVRTAELHEISIVSRPAYPAAQVEARNWNPANPQRSRVSALRRWRA